MASPLTRGRGSKHAGIAGAWIDGSRPSHGDADRNKHGEVLSVDGDSRPSHGDADRNLRDVASGRGVTGRPSHGDADRNYEALIYEAVARVAPHTGTRIETPAPCEGGPPANVAPHTGTRIETWQSRIDIWAGVSPLTRGRGSKPVRPVAIAAGLCRPSHGDADRNCTRPGCGYAAGRRPSHGDADRNFERFCESMAAMSRPSHGDADRNSPVSISKLSPARRPSHGDADRNNIAAPGPCLSLVAPHTGTRIETHHRPDLSACRSGRPSHGDADRNQMEVTGPSKNDRSPLTRGRGSKLQFPGDRG